ncbi:MAG TPA: MBL fold metallo-hydrolase [Frankiaceae bacterium]|nr:MBL fold metallo-hydrolase [Frankiaceae bacterium]
MTGDAPLLRFLGGAGTVTGSKFLVQAGGSRVLVDAGLFQGLRALRDRNRAKLPVPPDEIDAVVVSHAHLDHSGYLPALVRGGFRGPVFATAHTIELMRIILADSARLLAEEADYANRKGYGKHRPAVPLYTERDVEVALSRTVALPTGELAEIAPNVDVVLRRAGHILGSASVRLDLRADRRTVEFSGDLGRPDHPVLRPPEPPAGADVLVVESTYGDRTHEDVSARETFADAIVRTVARDGVVVIPAFAVDRTEVVLYHLRSLMESGRIPRVPVYADSPMALATLRVYRAAIAARSDEIRPGILDGDDPFDLGGLVEASSVEASMAIGRQQGPFVVVSASGMATGGRVVHHLTQRLPGERNTVILPGYQAFGTRGRALADGEQVVKMLGRYVPVRAEVVSVPGFSVHADSGELVDWMRRTPREPEMTYVVHGEPDASRALSERVRRELRRPCVVPRDDERVRLD